jgi:hypothetical protein
MSLGFLYLLTGFLATSCQGKYLIHTYRSIHHLPTLYLTYLMYLIYPKPDSKQAERIEHEIMNEYISLLSIYYFIFAT